MEEISGKKFLIIVIVFYIILFSIGGLLSRNDNVSGNITIENIA